MGILLSEWSVPFLGGAAFTRHCVAVARPRLRPQPPIPARKTKIPPTGRCASHHEASPIAVARARLRPRPPVPPSKEDTPDANRPREADLIVKAPCKSVFEETGLDPAHGGSAFWHSLPRVLGLAFHSFCFKGVIDVPRKRCLLRNIAAGRLQVAILSFFPKIKMLYCEITHFGPRSTP